MDLEALRAVKTIIVHDNCTDGLVSALLLKDVLWDAQIRFVQYGTDEYRNLKAETNMLFADFSPPADQAQSFIDAGTLILDHHKTAKATVQRFGDNGVFGDEVDDPGVCGALLCYRHVWLPLQEQMDEVLGTQKSGPREKFLQWVETFSILAGVRDTWQRQSSLWSSAVLQHEVLSFMPKERWMAEPLHSLASTWADKYSWIGEILLEKQSKGVAKAVKGARRVTTLKGTHLVIFEGVRKTSDAAELLDQETDVVIGFNYFEEDQDDVRVTKMIVSTRSHTTFDCSALAKFYGGGGHTKAAGFNVGVPVNDTNPYDKIEALLNAYELQ